MSFLEAVFWSSVLGCILFAASPSPPAPVWEQFAFALSFQFLLHFGVGFMDGLTKSDDTDTGEP